MRLHGRQIFLRVSVPEFAYALAARSAGKYDHRAYDFDVSLYDPLDDQLAHLSDDDKAACSFALRYMAPRMDASEGLQLVQSLSNKLVSGMQGTRRAQRVLAGHAHTHGGVSKHAFACAHLQSSLPPRLCSY